MASATWATVVVAVVDGLRRLTTRWRLAANTCWALPGSVLVLVSVTVVVVRQWSLVRRHVWVLVGLGESQWVARVVPGYAALFAEPVASWRA